MAFATKFLRPLPRASVFVSSSSSSSSSISNPARLCCVKFVPFKSFPMNFGSLLCNRVSNLRLPFSGAKGIYLPNSPFYSALMKRKILTGSQFSKGTILGASTVLGSISLRLKTSLAMDDGLMDAPQEDLNTFDIEKFAKIYWELACRLWLPFLFCWTLFINLNDPVLAVGKVILFLLSTKPSPVSVYIFLQKLRSSSSQDPHLSNLTKVDNKCLVVRKVEVEDYMVVCVTKVEMEDQKFTLLGVLGGWWLWPSSDDEFIAFLDKLTFLTHRLKSMLFIA